MTTSKKAVADLVASGVEHYGAGRLSEAISHWERALAIDPDAREAKEYLSYVRENFDSLKSQFEGGAAVPLQGAGADANHATMMGLPLPPTPGSSPAIISGIELDGAEYTTASPSQTLLGTPATDFPSSPTKASWGESGFDTSDSELITPNRQAIADFDLDLAPAVAVEDDEHGEDEGDVGTLERSQGISLPLETASFAGEEDDDPGTFPRPNALDIGDLELGSMDDDPETQDGLATAIRGEVGASLDETMDFGTLELDDSVAEPNEYSVASHVSQMEAIGSEILESIGGLGLSGGDDGVRARIEALLDKAEEENRAGHGQKAVVAASLALDEAPENVVAQKVIHERERELLKIFAGYLGSLASVPQLAVDLTELGGGIDSRDAFLLTRVDGILSFGDIIDISSMGSLAAHRTLCRFLVDGVIRL